MSEEKGIGTVRSLYVDCELALLLCFMRDVSKDWAYFHGWHLLSSVTGINGWLT